MAQSPVDQAPIPSGSVLVGEEHEISGLVLPRGQARGLEEHEGEQGVALGSAVSASARQPVGEPDRLAAEVVADEGVARVGRVALVEEQVDDLEDRVEPAGELLGRRHLEGDILVADEPLGPHERAGRSSPRG